jgi:hypothetical protein
MCSNGGVCRGGARRTGPDDVERLGQAIEQLARAARDEDITAQELADALAQVWSMVAELDPELARRMAAYGG